MTHRPTTKVISVFLLIVTTFPIDVFSAQIPVGSALITNTTGQDVVFYTLEDGSLGRKNAWTKEELKDPKYAWKKEELKAGQGDLYKANFFVLIATKGKSPKIYRLANQKRYQIIVSRDYRLELREVIQIKAR